jgi:hypothetical protein
MPRLTRFLNAFAKRVGGLGRQRRAVIADRSAGRAVEGGAGRGNASEGGRSSRQGPEGDEDKCLICCGGESNP